MNPRFTPHPPTPQFSLAHGFVKWLIARDEARVLIVGLDGAGKTSFLELVKGAFNRAHRPAAPGAVPPTIGMNLFKAGVADMDVTLWDVGGSLRGIWATYYDDADAVVFVLDAADRARFGEAARALEGILRATAGPVLVLANKQDRPDAARASEVADEVCRPAGLALGAAARRPTRILEVCAHRDDGTPRAAIEWVVGSLERT